MPRDARKPKSETVITQQQQWYQLTGSIEAYRLADWDPNTADVCQALLEIVADGHTVVLRPGSGGRALGVAVWSGENRPPAIWFGDQDELNAWSHAIIEAAAARRVKPAEDKG